MAEKVAVENNGLRVFRKIASDMPEIASLLQEGGSWELKLRFSEKEGTVTLTPHQNKKFVDIAVNYDQDAAFSSLKEYDELFNKTNRLLAKVSQELGITEVQINPYMNGITTGEAKLLFPKAHRQD